MSQFCTTSVGLEEGTLHRLHGAFADLMIAPEVENDWHFTERESPAGLVSPLAYAARQGEVSIIPGLAIGEVGNVGSVLLRFSPGHHSIRRVLYPMGSRLDQILTAIVLREKYQQTPSFHAVDEQGLVARDESDALLLPANSTPTENSLDLVDEWFDSFQLPFVRAITVAWNDMVMDPFPPLMQAIGEEADAASLSELDRRMQGSLSPDLTHQVFAHRRYLLDEDMQESLRVFYHFAFLHGLLRDVPDLTVWT